MRLRNRIFPGPLRFLRDLVLYSLLGVVIVFGMLALVLDATT